MKIHLSVIVSAALLIVGTASAQDAVPKLDEALKNVAAFEYGQDSGALRTIEGIVIAASRDARLRQSVEDRLISALAAGGTRDAREFLCRQLMIVGTSRCVPELEKLLTDEQLSHMARYALGRIEHPAAGAALHRALARTSGDIQIGIIGTLAQIGYRQARADITRLLASNDPNVAAAAANALGKLAGPESVKALQSARSSANEQVRQSIDDALIACADALAASGAQAQAVAIYRAYYAPDQPRALRIAALRGLAAAGGADALGVLAEAIKAPQPELRAMAIGFARSAKGAEATKMLAELLPGLPPDAQELLLAALGGRGDSSATPAVVASLKSENSRVRMAAYEALGRIGNASAVPMLAQAAAGSAGEEQRAARAALLRLAAPDANVALLKLLEGGDSRVQAEACRALAARHATGAFGPVLKLAVADDATARQAAMAALGELASADDLPAMVELAIAPRQPSDRDAIENAIKNAYRRVSDPQRRAAAVLNRLAAAPADAKPTLLRLLVNAPTEAALNTVLEAMKDQNQAVRDAATRALADWPNAAPADRLLELARTTDNATYRVLAMRGYVRMAGTSKDPTAMYVRAMELASRPDDKRLVLGGLGTAGTTQALDLVERHIADPDVQIEASLAAIQIAARIRESDGDRARRTLRTVIASVKDPPTRQKAVDLLNDLDQFEDHILTWVVSPMYQEKGKDSQYVFDTPFAPEKDAGSVEWKPLKRGIGKWDINLEATFGGQDHVAAYVRTRIYSPRAQEARLEMGSDDALKAWVNGQLVSRQYQHRGAAPRQEIVKIQLKEGWNDLMLKVVDHEGGWVFAARIRSAEGTALEGLKVQAP